MLTTDLFLVLKWSGRPFFPYNMLVLTQPDFFFSLKLYQVSALGYFNGLLAMLNVLKENSNKEKPKQRKKLRTATVSV